MPRFPAIAAAAWIVLASILPVAAQQPKQPESSQAGPLRRDMPFVIKADTIEHDRTNQIITLSGAVEITQGNRTLMADKVRYFQSPDTLTAEGHVILLDETQNVIYGDRAEVSGDFKDGIVESIRLRLADDSRLAAAGGRRTGGFRTEMRKAVYSPCLPCAEDPERAPLWQIKAIKVVHDEIDRDIEYTDGWLEFYGVPVMYLPYISHPDPTVRQRTGFLAPSYGSDSLLGAVIRLPFHIAIAPDEDATVTPIITSEEGPVLAGEYRNLFPKGRMDLAGSITHASVEDGDKDYRGHFFGDFRWDIDDTWRGKVDLAVTTDDTYLRRYSFDSRDTLVNQAQVEGFWTRSYAAANAYGFQGLRAEDDAGQTPIVLPMYDFNYLSEPLFLGSYFSTDANLMILTRTEGTDSRRLSLKSGWHLPYTSPIGELYRAYATIQADGYSVEDLVPDDATQERFTGFTGRFFPQAGLDWRYPFVRHGEHNSQIIEPVTGVIFAPNVGNRQDKIPNEDSLDIELDDTNIFDPNRFTGLDRVEGGHRLYYGLSAGNYGEEGSIMSFFLGQSYRLRDNSSFPDGSGLNRPFSDIVGRVRFSPVNWIDVLYRFRTDTRLDPQRNDVIARIGTPRLYLNTEYLFIEQPATVSEFGDREEILVQAGANITKHWSISGQTRRDLSEGGGILYNTARVAYADECITMSIEYTHRRFEDRDIKPSDTIFVRIDLKTLGDIGGSTSP